MDKIYFTKQGMDKFLQKIQEIENRLKNMYSRLAELADVGGDGYHDNFSYEQQMRDIGMLDEELAHQRKLLYNSTIVNSAQNKDKVAIGLSVLIEYDGQEEEWEIVGYGESDSDNRKIAYNTPLAQTLIGKQEEETVEFRKFKIVIKKIS